MIVLSHKIINLLLTYFGSISFVMKFITKFKILSRSIVWIKGHIRILITFRFNNIWSFYLLCFFIAINLFSMLSRFTIRFFRLFIWFFNFFIMIGVSRFFKLYSHFFSFLPIYFYLISHIFFILLVAKEFIPISSSWCVFL